MGGVGPAIAPWFCIRDWNLTLLQARQAITDAKLQKNNLEKKMSSANTWVSTRSHEQRINIDKNKMLTWNRRFEMNKKR